MSRQLEFWNTEPSQSANNRLFLAIFPSGGSSQAIHELAGGLRSRHGLTGKIRPLNHLHITVRWFGDFVQIPESLIQDVSSACESFTHHATPFGARFDHVLSWGKGKGKHHLVLLGHDNSELLAFHHALLKELIKHRCLGKGGKDFNPHITLLYDAQGVNEQSVSPVSWMVDEITLIHSEIGATKYHVLGRWKLRG